MCPHGRAHWRHLANTIELVLPSAHPSPQPKGQIDRFSRFAQLTAESPYTLQQAPLSHKVAPSHGGVWTPSKSCFFGPVRADKPNGITIGSAVFAQMTAPLCRRVSLYFTIGHPSPSKLPLPIGRFGPPSNTWLPGPIRVLNGNSISIGSALFQGSLV